MSKEIDKKMVKVERKLIGDLRNHLSELHYDISMNRMKWEQEGHLQRIGDLVIELTDVIHSDLTSFTPKEQVNLYGSYNPYIERLITEYYRKKEVK